MILCSLNNILLLVSISGFEAGIAASTNDGALPAIITLPPDLAKFRSTFKVVDLIVLRFGNMITSYSHAPTDSFPLGPFRIWPGSKLSEMKSKSMSP